MFWNKRMGRKTNAILATVMALFNAAHCFELLDFTPVQVPMLVGNLVVSVVLCVSKLAHGRKMQEWLFLLWLKHKS